MQLQIIHTNDIHSNFDSLPKLLTKIKTIRKPNSLLLDAGDLHDFKSIILEASNGLAGSLFLSKMGYDAITIGNNEGFAPINCFNTMIENAMMVFICCNLVNLDGSKIIALKPSIIKVVDGKRVLIIGSTTNGEDSYNAFFKATNLKCLIASECIAKELAVNAGLYDICIVLSHLGLNNDRALAKQVDGIDIIIGGHTHNIMDQVEIVNTTFIYQAGKFGQYLSELNFEIDSHNKVKLTSNTLYDCLHESDDLELQRLIKHQEISAINILSKPLFINTYDLYHEITLESPATNLVAQALYDKHPEVDFSIINAGILNGGFLKGPFSQKRLLDVCPSPLNVTRFFISGANLILALTQSLNATYCLNNGRGAGFRGHYIGSLSVSNNVLIIHTYTEIVSITIDGELIIPDNLYHVVSSDYLQRGSGYPSLKDDSTYIYDDDYIRDLIPTYLNNLEHQKLAFVKRFQLIDNHH